MSRIKKGFDVLSGWYDYLLYFTSGNSILKSQLLLSSYFPSDAKILILGGGTGSFLLELLKMEKASHVVYADISEGMIRQSKSKISNEPEFVKKVDFRTGGIELVAPGEKFDFIVTNYFLDLYSQSQLDELVPVITERLKDGGKWLVTDFNVGSNPVSKPVFSFVTSLLYLFFKITCGLKISRLADIPKALKIQYLTLENEQFMLRGLLRSALYKKMKA